MKLSKMLGLLLLTAMLAALPSTARATSYNVQLTTPVSNEWSEDTYGGIWHAVVTNSADNSVVSTNGLVMCSGDLRDIYIGQVTGPYAPYSLLSVSQAVVASDPGDYNFPSGFSLASRTADVKAQAAFLIDQMNNVLALPANAQAILAANPALDSDDLVEIKGDALVGAIHKIWDGVAFSPEVAAPSNPEYTEEQEEFPLERADYNDYMAAIAGVNASNYTSSQSIWLVDPNAQVLFANFSGNTPPDPTVSASPVPEPLTMVAVGMGRAALGGYIRRRVILPATLAATWPGRAK